MRFRARSGSLVVIGLAVGLCLAQTPPQPTPRETPRGDRAHAAGPDWIGFELQKRIRGQAKLDDLRIEVTWLRSGGMVSARVYGNGVGVWNRKAQFRISKEQVISLLEALQASRFGSMPDRFGGSKEEKKNERPRLKGSIAVRAGWVPKTVIQLVAGEQSQEFASLAERLLTICEEPARKSVGAASLSDGLKKLASGDLAPETLEVTVQRRFAKPNDETGAGWILRLEGRRVLAEALPAGKIIPPQKLLTLSEADFQSLATLLTEERAAEIPINVYAPEYTDLQLEVLNWSRAMSARRFLNMTPETHGDRQKAFDRLYEAFRTLYERARKEGATVPAPPASRAPEKKKEAAKEKS